MLHPKKWVCCVPHTKIISPMRIHTLTACTWQTIKPNWLYLHTHTLSDGQLKCGRKRFSRADEVRNNSFTRPWVSTHTHTLQNTLQHMHDNYGPHDMTKHGRGASCTYINSAPRTTIWWWWRARYGCALRGCDGGWRQFSEPNGRGAKELRARV